LSGIALGIVLTSALLHAGWNYLLKKSDRKIVFIWWFLLASLVLYFPMFLYCWGNAPIPPAGWLCIVATGLIHAAYFWFMGGAYQRGDLSLVYPPVYIYIMVFITWLALTPWILIRERGRLREEWR
jgi:drug/metabolite transporter (DMT)-like permease